MASLPLAGISLTAPQGGLTVFRVITVVCLLCAVPLLVFAVQSTNFYPNTNTVSIQGPPYPTPYTSVNLGRELGSPFVDGKLRHRAFAIID